jgi:hypothetical protein
MTFPRGSGGMIGAQYIFTPTLRTNMAIGGAHLTIPSYTAQFGGCVGAATIDGTCSTVNSSEWVGSINLVWSPFRMVDIGFEYQHVERVLQRRALTDTAATAGGGIENRLQLTAIGWFLTPWGSHDTGLLFTVFPMAGSPVGAHRGRRGVVGKQIELAFLDPVLHLATSAVDLLVKMLPANVSRFERGGDEARIGLTASHFGLADHAAAAAPAVRRRPREVLEGPCRSAGPQPVQAGQQQPAPAARCAPGRTESPRDWIAPCHQPVAGEAGIAASASASGGSSGGHRVR